MKIVALAGGVGGAKFAHGLALAVPPENLTVVVNTGDDFDHFGLRICPDLDTVCYTLAGLGNAETGWGRASETWLALGNAVRLGGPDWFNIGDQDLGTHLERTRRLKAGSPLSKITADFCCVWGIQSSVLPMTDDSVRTIVSTRQEGELGFQDYFVRRRCIPEVTGFRFVGVKKARPAPGVLDALEKADVLVFCPSNPWVSIDPILKIPGVEDAVRRKAVIAISPIIGGKAVKGPAAKMFSELGMEPSALAVAAHYRPLLKGFVLAFEDVAQTEIINGWGIISLATDILIPSLEERRRLAEEVLSFCEFLLRR